MEKSRKLLWVLLVIILLIASAAGGYYLRDNSTKDLTNDEQSFENSADNKDDTINWIKYYNSELPDISFDYPESSTLTTSIKNDSETTCINNECWSITIEYEDMKFEITRINGIGGVDVELDGEYRTVYDGPFMYINSTNGGIFCTTEVTDNGEMKYIYAFYYLNNGTKWVPVQGTTPVLIVKQSDSQKYLAVSDRIARSLYGVE